MNKFDKIPEVMQRHIASYVNKMQKYPELAGLYKNCYLSTWTTALKACGKDSCFVLTGDIPAMWLRDSSAQVSHYLTLLNEDNCSDIGEIADMFRSVLRRQFMYIGIDPYANAFNEEANGHACGKDRDLPTPCDWVWERKYEIDSLCYPIRLLYNYYLRSGDEELVRELLPGAAEIILNVFKTEQHHAERSEYRFTRLNAWRNTDTLQNDGMGSPVVYTGMTWSGFRPSDDACEYGYLIASNMFAVVSLRQMSELLKKICGNIVLAEDCMALAEVINTGIEKYGIIEHERYGRMYVCETDGKGNFNLLDDANVPSLLAAPYLGYLDKNDDIYRNTRKFLLSRDNPFYFEGKCAHGIGSPHTPDGYIWHMSLVMQGLTSDKAAEKKELLEMLVSTDAGTGHLHEGFLADDPKQYTREWFTWPEALFSEFVEMCVDEGIV